MSPPSTQSVADVADADIPTEHPHVVRRAGVCGGSPRIRGTRIPVRNIAVLHNAGEPIAGILANFPHLQPTWIHDAISYYLDHRSEIDREIEENDIHHALAGHGLTMDERGVIHLPGRATDAR